MTQYDRTLTPEKASPTATIEHLVGAYYAYIRRIALSLLDDPHEADDAAQETFIAAFRALRSYRGEAHAKTWLTAIALNACRGRLRKRKTRQALQVALGAIHLQTRHPSPEETADQNESGELLWQAVDSLDEKHRLPVILRYVHELTVPEIAEVLSTSQGTVHSRLYYAREKLQARLGHLNPREEAPDETVIPY